MTHAPERPAPLDVREAGFSLVEVSVAMFLMLVIMGAALRVVAPATGTGRTEPEVVDVQQRARAGADLLVRDLSMAGAGVDRGPGLGPLRRFFAPVVPRRMGLEGADDYATARADAITILFVPSTWSQTTLREPLPAGADLRVDLWPGCPPGDALCGLAAGSHLLVFDRLGHFDGFTMTSVLADAGHLRSWGSQPPFAYPIGSTVTGLEWHTYYFDAANRQLRHADGYLTDVPVADDVVGLSFEYFGDPRPPEEPKPPLGTASCLFDTAGNLVPGLSVLPAQGTSLSALPLSLFRDGPWCGDGNNRYDADLLRIRMVRVLLRVQVGNDAMRGRSSDYAVGGSSLNAARSLPDYALRFDIAPRNLAWGRPW